MKRLSFAIVAMFVVALVLPLPASARKQSVATPQAARIVNLDVQVWTEDPSSPSGTTLIVVAQLPTGTPMPAKVLMPVPAGAGVSWSGEIFSGTGSADVPRPFTTETPAGDVIAITTQKSRVVQYEAAYAAPQTQGGRRVETLAWVQTAPADTVSFSFKVPVLASDVRTNPAYVGTPDVNSTGEKLYSLVPRPLATGSALKVSVDYLIASTSSSVPAQRDLLLPILVGLLVIAVVALAVVALRQRTSTE